MRKLLFVALAVLSITMVALPAHANYLCQGAINYLGVQSYGVVTVGGPGGLPPINLCQFGVTSSNGITADSCKAMYAELLSAHLSGVPVNIFFNDALTCTTQPAWSDFAAVYHISL